MKKTRFLVLALAVAIMMVGAGYAWWSESVQVNTTVATGYLDVDAQNGCAYVEYLTKDLTHFGQPYYTADINNYATAGIAITPPESINDNDTVNITFTDMYPGSRGTAKFDVVNNSTMAVKLVRCMAATLSGDLNICKVTITPKFVNENPGPDSTIDLVPVIQNGQLVGFSMPDGRDDINFAKSDKLEVTVIAEVDKTLGNPNGMDGERGNLALSLSPKFVQFNDFETR